MKLPSIRYLALSPFALLLILPACTAKPGQQAYRAGEVGVSRAVEFGTVLNVRVVDIIAEEKKNTRSGTAGFLDAGGDVLGDDVSAGAILGAGAGAGAGTYVGDGTGEPWAIAGGAVLGAVLGDAIERRLKSSTGHEYVVQLQNGDIKTIVQENIEGDKLFRPGEHVMLQYCDAGEHTRKCEAGKDFQRLLPIEKLPPYPAAGKKKHDTYVMVEE